MQSFPIFEPFFRLISGSVMNDLVRLLAFGYGNAPAANGIGPFTGLRVFKSPAPTALTTSATLTAAQLINGMFTANQGGAAAATYTLPTAALLGAALPADFAIDDGFDICLTNISTVAAEDITIATAAGWTLVGKMTVESNAAVTDNSFGRFRVRKTANTPTFTLTRIG